MADHAKLRGSSAGEYAPRWWPSRGNLIPFLLVLLGVASFFCIDLLPMLIFTYIGPGAYLEVQRGPVGSMVHTLGGVLLMVGGISYANGRFMRAGISVALAVAAFAFSNAIFNA